MITSLFSNKKNETNFSKFIREGSSREKKRLFMSVIKKATEDQKKIMPRTKPTLK